MPETLDFLLLDWFREFLFQKNRLRAGKHLLAGGADGGSEFGGLGGLQAGLDDVVHQCLKIFEPPALGIAVSFEQRGAFEDFRGQLIVPGYGSSDTFEPVVDPILLEGKTVGPPPEGTEHRQAADQQESGNRSCFQVHPEVQAFEPVLYGSPLQQRACDAFRKKGA